MDERRTGVTTRRVFSPSYLTTRRASSSCFLPHGLSASTLLRFSLRQFFSWPDLLIYKPPSLSTDAILLFSSPYRFLFCEPGFYHGTFSLQCDAVPRRRHFWKGRLRPTIRRIFRGGLN